MRRVPFLLGAALLGFLLVAVSAEASVPAGSASSDALCKGVPNPPKSFDAPDVAPLPQSPAGPFAAPTSCARENVQSVRTSFRVDRESILIEARLLEKYLAFRESLTSP